MQRELSISAVPSDPDSNRRDQLVALLARGLARSLEAAVDRVDDASVYASMPATTEVVR